MQNVLPLTKYSVYDPRRKKGYALLKRTFDIIGSLLLIIALLPVLALVMVVAMVDTKGAAFFVQTRMGRYGIPFQMIKFRTMSVDAPANVATHQLNDAENYISKVGGVLRRLSLDELPQLFNILKGDMSFIGPRPVVLTETDLLKLRDRNGAVDVRPGLTGWAQVNGRDNVTIAEKAKLDAYYARHFSLKMDVKIFFKTITCVLGSKGICEGANPAITAGKCPSERSA